MSKRILIVDDEPDLLEVLGIIFRAHGFSIGVAKDGEQALASIAQDPPDLVLMDVMMPRLNGIEVCRRLKAAPETEALPVVMLTAKAHDLDRCSGLEAGADAYLAKPFDNAELIRTVRRLVAGAAS